MKKFCLWVFVLLFGAAWAEEEQPLSLQVIDYDLLVQGDFSTLQTLHNALFLDGIVGVRGVPSYREKVDEFLRQARAFAALPEEVKQQYEPNRERGDLFLGYEKGKEKFQRSDGRWVVDDLKASYYAFVPDDPRNLWPKEVDLQSGFATLAALMRQMGMLVMEKIGLIGPNTGISIHDTSHVGRLIHYQKTSDTNYDNPLWCGEHFDHSMFTALTPAAYFVGGEEVPEPLDAGLFVKVHGTFQKITADPDLLLFQVGEFGQLILNDGIQATEHRVHKAAGSIERYALALFFEAPPETVIHSTSKLALDARYGGVMGAPCSYKHWGEESFKRYTTGKTK